MSDDQTPSGFAATLDERERAYARFKATLDVHNAAIHVFETLHSLPNGREAIAAGIRMNRGMAEGLDQKRVDSYVDDMFDVVANEREAGFSTIRSSALIAACGALEYLLKATFVNQALFDPAKAAAKLSRKRIRLLASEVLSCLETEQWFLIADRLFEQLADEERQMHKRVRLFLREYTLLPGGQDQTDFLDKAFSELDAFKFDEAFLVRNCMVHNGGRVSAALSQHSNQPIGKEIVFQRKALAPLLKPLRGLAEDLNSLFLYGLGI